MSELKKDGIRNLRLAIFHPEGNLLILAGAMRSPRCHLPIRSITLIDSSPKTLATQ